MSDDCANSWGVVLAASSPTHDANSRRFAAFQSAESATTEFRRRIARDLNGSFTLTRVMSCGSDANMLAIMELCRGETSRCLIAAGCYVAGDSGPLQCWSTCTFALEKGPSRITPPHLVIDSFVRDHTIALPYAIEGSMEVDARERYEDECVKELNLRCWIATMMDLPYKCLFLELMLASNGSSLSNRALSMIAKVAERHKLDIIVDEVMTGGRSGSMLMVQKKPPAFLARVSHVTLGKWTQMGLILESSEFHQRKASIHDHTTKRGESTYIDRRPAMSAWSDVFEHLNLTSIRRDQVLEKLRVSPSESWGEGCLIFAPVRRNGVHEGTKNRFLPRMSINMKIDKFKVTKMPSWSKENINEIIVDGVRAWLTVPLSAQRYNIHYRTLITYLSQAKTPCQVNTEEVRAAAFPSLSMMAVCGLLRTAERAGLVSYILVGRKRCRCWVLRDDTTTRAFEL